VTASDGFEGTLSGSPLVYVAILAAFAILPFALIMLTSFVKISVVLSIARTALGTPQIPPGPVVTGLALILTAHVMSPVAIDIRDRAAPVLKAHRDAETAAVDLVLEVAAVGRAPLARFLRTHGTPRDRALFADLTDDPERREAHDDDLLVLIPAFVISELREAFEIGFIVFLPFLVIDMVVANVLLALGMQMLSPTTISLPFKLLLFVMIDGWRLLSESLLRGYGA